MFLAELPDRLAGIAERWGLRLGVPLPIGIGGYLVLVRTPEGGEAVLKLSPTGGEQDRANELEAWALGRWAGVGAVRLYRCDVSAGALLIERCLPGTSVDSLPDDEMVAAGCGLAHRLHRQPDDEDHRVLSEAMGEVSERADALDGWMGRMGRPLSAAAERAVAEAHARAMSSSDSVVVCHGDLNPGNILSAQREPWLTVDPLPLLAPPAYDAVSLVWSKRDWLLARPAPSAVLRRRIELAAEALGIAASDVWAWTLVRATGILIDRFSWGGYNEAPFVQVIELLTARQPDA